MVLFVGLGNKGKEYAATRHNAGFMALDALRAKHADAFGNWQKKFNAELCEGRLGVQKVVLMKPQTFMNASGDAVAPAVGFWKLDPTRDVCMVYDEIDIPLGNIRIRADGTPGGHNGVKSVLAACGTQQVARIRIGIGTERAARVPSEDFVLEAFAAEEREVIAGSIEKAVGAMEALVVDGLQTAQMQFGS
jgi:PTH1 family peptidyl-tRNA hydrolase